MRWIERPQADADGWGGSRLRQYIGHGPRADDEPYGAYDPQAFLVKLEGGHPGLRVHFHPVDQFQYFVGGGGTYAGHTVRPGLVHYADRLQPYGPLAPADSGMAMLTLRAATDTGAHYMPEARDDLRGQLASSGTLPSERLNFTVDLLEGDWPEGWTTLRERADGHAIRVGVPGASALDPVAVGGGGAYVVVVSGEIGTAATPVPTSSIAWQPAGEVTDPIAAIGDSARVAILQLPPADTSRWRSVG